MNLKRLHTIFGGVLFSVLLSSSSSAFAWASEPTQILNNIELVLQYTMQVQQFQSQLQQTATMLQNLQANPNGVSVQNLNQMAANEAQLMSRGQNIASSMATVDANYAQTFNSPEAASYSTKFGVISSASMNALKSAMLSAGLQREQFPNDTAAIQKLTSNLASSQGNVSALQALGAINASQIQESMKLRDLLSQQQVAQNTYYAAQQQKEINRQAEIDSLGKPYSGNHSTIERKSLVDWNTVFPTTH